MVLATRLGVVAVQAISLLKEPRPEARSGCECLGSVRHGRCASSSAAHDADEDGPGAGPAETAPGGPGSDNGPGHTGKCAAPAGAGTGAGTGGATAGDAGMSTVEYAVGTVVAAAFAAVLYQIVTGDSVVSGLTDLINRALSTSF